MSDATTAKVAGRELPREEWHRFFDQLNRRLEHGPPRYEATIEVLGDRIGGQEAERLPLVSMTWEDGDDVVAISVGGRGRRYPVVLRHFVDRPRRAVVAEDGGEPREITLVSADGTRTRVMLYRVAE
jgi:hypothetical protein